MSSPAMYQVRRMQSRDVCDVEHVAHEAEQEMSTEEEVRDFMNKTNAAGLVALDTDGNVIGYTLFRDANRFVLVEALGVAVEWRRKGVATALVRELYGVFRMISAERIAVHVPERMLPGQLFWKAAGLKAYKVLRGCHVSGDDLFAFGIERAELFPPPAGQPARKEIRKKPRR